MCAWAVSDGASPVECSQGLLWGLSVPADKPHNAILVSQQLLIMYVPRHQSNAIAADLMRPALQSLTAMSAGHCSWQDIVNLAMTARLAEYVERYIRAPIPKRPEALQLMISECALSIKAGEALVVYEEDVKQVRRWIQLTTRVLAQQRPERIHGVLGHIRDAHAIRTVLSGDDEACGAPVASPDSEPVPVSHN